MLTPFDANRIRASPDWQTEPEMSPEKGIFPAPRICLYLARILRRDRNNGQPGAFADGFYRKTA